MKKRSFAFSLVYIKCFRTYSVYLSLRLPAQILYAVIHLPPQREPRRLRRKAQSSALRRAALAMRRSRNNPSVFLPERAKKQLPLHRGAEVRAPFTVRQSGEPRRFPPQAAELPAAYAAESAFFALYPPKIFSFVIIS